MVVMSDDPKPTNFEKRFKGHILYDGENSDKGFFLGLKGIVAYAEEKEAAEGNGI